MAGRATFSAYEALITRIRGINGAPTYHHNLEGRVYQRLFFPNEKALKLPYACVPALDAEAAIGDNEGPLEQALFVIPGFLFVPDTLSSEAQSEGGSLALKAFDDVVAALMTDWTLGGTCEETRIVGWAVAAGEVPDLAWGVTRVDIQIRAHLGQEFLGP